MSYQFNSREVLVLPFVWHILCSLRLLQKWYTWVRQSNRPPLWFGNKLCIINKRISVRLTYRKKIVFHPRPVKMLLQWKKSVLPGRFLSRSWFKTHWLIRPLAHASIMQLFILNHHVDFVCDRLARMGFKRKEAQLSAAWYLITANNRKRQLPFHWSVLGALFLSPVFFFFSL